MAELHSMINIDNKKIIDTFIGNYSSIPRKVIVTPIEKIYKYLLSSNGVIQVRKGWWKSSIIEIRSNNVLLSKIHPGTTIIDFVLSLKNYIKKIVFIGYCGGLNYKLKIGDIVYAESAYLNGQVVKNPAIIDSSVIKLKGKIGMTQAFLLETEDMLKTLLNHDVIALDMETYFLYYYCYKFGIKSYSLSVVTDLPFKKRFYGINTEGIL